jgi:NAD(P)-dependent dehydrogenase (short-subunit alcohol dehydrogenase family)
MVMAVTPLSRFQGKVALLTAAGSGIGAATAERLAAEGATVVVTDILDEPAIEVVRRITNWGGKAGFRHLDVRSPSDWTRVVTDVIASHMHVDVLHLNAGKNIAAPIAEISTELWNRQLDLTLNSVMYGVRATLEHLLVAKGSIVITSSIHAVIGLRGFPAYAAAKGGVSALTRQLAAEYGPNLRVNAVQPGAIETPMWGGTSEGARSAVARVTPAGRMGKPEEVAAAVAFLASDDASYITGVNLVVDGGRVASALD